MSGFIEVFAQVMDPFPVGEPAGFVVAVFTSTILLLFGIGLLQEGLLSLRGLKLLRVLSDLEQRGTLKGLAQLEESGARLREAAPALTGATRKLEESAYTQGGRLCCDQPAAELIRPELLRAPGGGVILPDALLRALPGLLTAVGIFGTFVGLVKGLGDYRLALVDADFEAGIRVLISGLAISFRSSVWGLLTSILLTLLGGWAVGLAELAADRAAAFFDEHLPRGSSAQQTAELLELQRRAIAMQEEAGRAEEGLRRAEQERRELAEQALAAQRQSAEAIEGVRQLLAHSAEARPAQQRALSESLDRLGDRLEAALSASLAQQLGPTLGEIQRLSRETAEGTQRFVSRSTQAQVEGIGQIVQQVVTGLDRAIGDNLRSTGESLAEAAAAQAASLDRWRLGVEGVEALLSRLEESAAQLKEGVGRAGEAAEPLAQAADRFLEASAELNAMIPRLQSASAGYLQAQVAIAEATDALREGQAGFTAAGEGVGELLGEVRGGLDRWREGTETFAGLVGELDRSAEGMRVFAERLHEVAAPTADVARSFRQASATLDGAVPRLERLAEVEQSAGARFERAAEKLSRGTDAALRETREAFAVSAAQLAEGTHRALEDTERGLAASTAQLAEGTGAALAETRQRFAEASEQLAEGSAEALRTSRESLERAALTLSEGTADYTQAAQLVLDMVEVLNQSHERAIARISTGVDEALGEGLRTAGERLEAISGAQAEQLTAWQDSLTVLAPALTELQRTASTLEGAADRFRDAALPAADAGESFRVAAREVGRLFPRLEQSAQRYNALGEALESASAELEQSARAYAGAGGEVVEAAGLLRAAMDQQREGAAQTEAALTHARQLAEALPPASDGLRQAAAELQGAASESSGLIRGVIDAASTVGEQSEQWRALHDEMARLQVVLGEGVDAFTERLPASIDHTLVHFDAALAEGVERLGGAVERLREAMDDLQERLEILNRQGR